MLVADIIYQSTTHLNSLQETTMMSDDVKLELSHHTALI